nr:plasmid stabilization protein [Amycolatopsis rubida]
MVCPSADRVATEHDEGGSVPEQSWSDKRERQYDHIKSSQKKRGASTGRAEEIAARTVNKNRAQAGESRAASKTSTQDMSPQKRGGQRSGNRQGPGGPTKDQLYNEAKKRNIKGRSSMTKKELQNALGR